MEVQFKGSVAEVTALFTLIRGEVIDDATITKLHALNQTVNKDADALAAATPK